MQLYELLSARSNLGLCVLAVVRQRRGERGAVEGLECGVNRRRGEQGAAVLEHAVLGERELSEEGGQKLALHRSMDVPLGQ